MEMQSKTRVELRLKVKILFKMSNWEKDSGWSRKKNRLITLGHHTVGMGEEKVALSLHGTSIPYYRKLKKHLINAIFEKITLI